jgi:hypothetical protein
LEQKRCSIYRSICIAVCALFLGLIPISGCRQNEEFPLEQEVGASGEGNPVKQYAQTITTEELKEHITYLASDKLEGRHSGTIGAGMAANYIANHFQDLNLNGFSGEENPYFQKFLMVKKKPVESYLESEHGRLDNWDEFMEMHCDFFGERDVDLIFAGYGRDIDLERIDLRGTLVAFFMGNPDADEIGNDLERVKIAAALERGAIGHMIIVHDDEDLLKYIHQIKPYFNKPRYYQDKSPEDAAKSERNIVTTTAAAAKLFGLSPETLKSAKEEMKRGKNQAGMFQVKIQMKTSFETLETISAENVLGYLEGCDKKQECIIFTAHYDHLGKSGQNIYNGAYDNASGVAAVMEIAEAFVTACAEGHCPRRSLLFLTPDAEELGGIGSIYYTDHPVFPLSDTVVDVNIDGIGREDASRPGLKDFVHVYLSRNGKPDLQKMRDEAIDAISIKLRLEQRENYGGSDNVFFERELIPAIALSTGHPKDHHKPTDTADKIKYKNVQAIAQLAFAMAWEIANSEQRIQSFSQMK